METETVWIKKLRNFKKSRYKIALVIAFKLFLILKIIKIELLISNATFSFNLMLMTLSNLTQDKKNETLKLKCNKRKTEESI